jgi:hypothetical protein
MGSHIIMLYRTSFTQKQQMATSGKNLICHSSLNDNCTASLFFNDGDPDAEEALSVDCCTSLDDLNRKNTMIPILARIADGIKKQFCHPSRCNETFIRMISQIQ